MPITVSTTADISLSFSLFSASLKNMKNKITPIAFCLVASLVGCGDKSDPGSSTSTVTESPQSSFTQDFEKRASQGDAEAKYKLSDAYESGTYGYTVNKTKALSLLIEAAELGYHQAQYHLAWRYIAGNGVEQNKTRGLSLLEKAAERDYTAAMNLYEMYQYGRQVSQDGKKATYWLGRATLISTSQDAEAGNEVAQVSMGHFYKDGTNVPKDVAKAFQWYLRAAIQGNLQAQKIVALAYLNGEGAPEDVVLGYAWLNIAAAQQSGGTAKAIKARVPISSVERYEAEKLASTWVKGQALTRNGSIRTSNSAEKNSEPQKSTGTVFAVSLSGHGVTNNHVVSGCNELKLNNRSGAVKVLTTDPTNDLALVQLPGEFKDAAPISTTPSSLRQGDEVVVFGYPLNSVVSAEGNLTLGIISALTGLENNTNQFQMTAQVQPGSSGSPVMNRKGEIIGVVSMKLSDSKMVKATGSVAQNVNFATNGQTLKSFLEAHKVSYKTSTLAWFEQKPADLGTAARQWTYMLECSR